MFEELIQSIQDDHGQWDSLEALMAERADIILTHAFEGFGMSYDEAMHLLKNADDLNDEQMIKRDILVAAVDNLVDFSVAEEYQMAQDLSEVEFPEEDQDIEEELAEMMAIFKKYNYQYAWIENLDVEYAMIMAAYLSAVKDDTALMYMTMGDERVRPWHLQYEGFTAPKSRFPAWLIPPIEHGCRCYLVEEYISSEVPDIQNAVSQRVPEMPSWFNKTFKESIALGGRIFSDEHPYFQIDGFHQEQLDDISKRIKNTYLNGTSID